MTKSTAISLLLLSSLAVTAQGAATYNAQPGRHAPPYLASKLGNSKRSAQGWLERIMGANPQSQSPPSEPEFVASSPNQREAPRHKRSPQASLDRTISANRRAPSPANPTEASTEELEYYGVSYGLVSRTALRSTRGLQVDRCRIPRRLLERSN